MCAMVRENCRKNRKGIGSHYPSKKNQVRVKIVFIDGAVTAIIGAGFKARLAYQL